MKILSSALSGLAVFLGTWFLVLVSRYFETYPSLRPDNIVVYCVFSACIVITLISIFMTRISKKASSVLYNSDIFFLSAVIVFTGTKYTTSYFWRMNDANLFVRSDPSTGGAR